MHCSFRGGISFFRRDSKKETIQNGDGDVVSLVVSTEAFHKMIPKFKSLMIRLFLQAQFHLSRKNKFISKWMPMEIIWAIGIQLSELVGQMIRIESFPLNVNQRKKSCSKLLQWSYRIFSNGDGGRRNIGTILGASLLFLYTRINGFIFLFYFF